MIINRAYTVTGLKTPAGYVVETEVVLNYIYPVIYVI